MSITQNLNCTGTCSQLPLNPEIQPTKDYPSSNQTPPDTSTYFICPVLFCVQWNKQIHSTKSLHFNSLKPVGTVYSSYKNLEKIFSLYTIRRKFLHLTIQQAKIEQANKKQNLLRVLRIKNFLMVIIISISKTPLKFLQDQHWDKQLSNK